jgi:diguanylate cyclase (GGDEF)-like protein/PAS domain S-box-containing protein
MTSDRTTRSRLPETAVLIRVIAYLQFTGVVMASVWLVLTPVDEVSRAGLVAGVLLVSVSALCTVTLLAKVFKRDVVEAERLTAIVEHSQDAIFSKDRKGLITVWNRGAQRLYGYTSAEVIGQPVSLLIPPDHGGEDREILRRVLSGEHVEDYQTERLCKDGSLVTVSLAVSPIRDPDGHVIGASSIARDVTPAMRAQETILHQTLYDGLTGLPNRTLFLDRVAHALPRSDRRGQLIAVLLVDLDRFTLVNDSLGHDAGDELLRRVADRLAGTIRAGDTLARFGGDEFAVLLEALPSEASAGEMADRLASVLKGPEVLSGVEYSVSGSIGIACRTIDSTAGELLRDADTALRRAKAAGRGRSERFREEIRSQVLGRVRTESALRAALATDDEIYVHYQPLVSLRTHQVVGAEALARWTHPDWGPVGPIDFIPVAEDSGLIYELGARVMRRAAHDCARWQQQAGFGGVAVNVSTRQLVESDGVSDLVSEVIATEGITPGFLTLEITESVLIECLEEARLTLESLHDLGVRLSLDDFGTGYSSLSYLSVLPFQSVKIDRTLIGDIVTPRAGALVAAIIQMGHALNLQVIAEGVETMAQAARLQALDCDLAQGFYFGAPMASGPLTALIANHPDWLSGTECPPMPIAHERQAHSRVNGEVRLRT